MMEIKSACGICEFCCGIIVTVEDGKAVGLRGDPDHFLSKGSLCPKGRAGLEFLYSPDRLQYPLKRVGEKGQGRWERISWDDALEFTAESLNKSKKEDGAESVCMIHGSAKDFIDTHLVRLANAFGTPNVANVDHVCFLSRMLGMEYTFGAFAISDYENVNNPTGCIVLWGADKTMTGAPEAQRIRDVHKAGANLITIDPYQTSFAKKSDIWLQIRPGTDLVLALGLIHLLIQEDLYDSQFVRQWTNGFDELKNHVASYTPEYVADITWLSPELVRKSAKMFVSGKPCHIEIGNGVDQGINCLQTIRAICILMALTGNLDRPGGELLIPAPGYFPKNENSQDPEIRQRFDAELELRQLISNNQRRKKITSGLLEDYRYVNSQSFVKSVLHGAPYPIKAAFIQGSNPLSVWSNAKNVRKAFQQLDFLAVSDLFLTPTAALADIIFPVAGYLEFEGLRGQTLGGGPMLQYQPKIAQVGECRSDHEIINGLADKLGLRKHFWNTIEEFWDFVLAPTGKTFAEAKENITVQEMPAHNYKSYEQEGFDTPSGKVELYSNYLKEAGFDALPIYQEPMADFSIENSLDKEYPLICTCRKTLHFIHSGGKQIPSLRKKHMVPVVTIHPDTAKRLNIADEDLVVIESKIGKIEQTAKLSDKVSPGVVFVDPCWWFPEKGEIEGLGWAEANYNILSDDGPFQNREIGSYNMRGFACKIYKSDIDMVK